ncbi:MAG: hypothetical protein Q4A98_00370 [Comamonadaceae bacterium]|nr:hypothetical protein [Comamonadaceae bacterium]
MLTPDEIYCLRKEQGFTRITCASDSANLRALCEAGDLSGYLWKQGLFNMLANLPKQGNIFSF